MALNKHKILAAEDRTVVEVEVPEWGDSVRLMVLQQRDREWLEDQREKNDNLFAARAVAAALVDDRNQRMFVTEEEIKELAAKSTVVLTRLFHRVLALNGMTRQAVEEMEKNSGGGRNGSSASGSAAYPVAPTRTT